MRVMCVFVAADFRLQKDDLSGGRAVSQGKWTGSARLTTLKMKNRQRRKLHCYP